ncbi:MAG: FeoB-associated Cys-rich membrane protein [Candidatus Anammoximicrobium sp.]|nr:FeoB-associated Cys-rich membrane protein [Candidatus Anammoximicrobium sp.]
MPDAQQLLTLALVLAAAGYLVRRTWKRLSGRPVARCGSCSRCPGAADGRSPAAKPLIPVEDLIASAAHGVKGDSK